MKNKEVKSIFSSLENYSSIPPPDLWDKIEVQLEQPKKNRRMILWWSIAASLVVGLSIPTIMYFTSGHKGIELNMENNSNQIVFESSKKENATVDKTNSDNSIGISNDSFNKNDVIEQNVIDNESNTSKVNKNDSNLENIDNIVNTAVSAASSTDKGLSKVKNSEHIYITKSNPNSAVALKNGTILHSKTGLMNDNNGKNNLSKEDSKTASNQNAVVVASRSKVMKNNATKNITTNDNKKAVVNNAKLLSVPSELKDINDNVIEKICTKDNQKAVVNNPKVLSIPSKAQDKNDSGFQNTISKANNKKVVLNQNDVVSGFSTNTNNQQSTSAKSELISEKTVYVSNSKTSGKENASTQKNINVSSNTNTDSTEKSNKKDSLNKIKIEVAQLEKALVELEKDKIKKSKTTETIDKWSLQVFAGVMSSQNYNNEKALGNAVASQQSGGYGVKTNYKLNKKWAVSSGFKINELGQKIQGASYYKQVHTSGTVARALPLAKNFAQNSSSNLEVVSISTNQEYLFATNTSTSNGFVTGDVKQNLKYFEMPIDISYALLNKKKVNITMNTGGFVGKLISNAILLDGNSIGENKNANEYVYGTLLSSTLQYEIYKKTKFFIEPGMNYYINPLENQNFNQFQYMFNVGLNVSF